MLRTTSTGIRAGLRLLLVTALAALVSVPLSAATSVAPAHAQGTQTVTKQVTYTCQIAGVQGTASVAIVISANLPQSVSPGESVSVSGSMVLRLPDNVRAAAQYAEITEVEGYSDTVTTPITINGQTSVLLLNRVIAPRVTIGNPMIITASFSAPTFVVPADASGSIVIEAPQNGTVSNPRSDANPKMVAFTAMATVYGATGSQSIGMFCYYPTEMDRVIATIPVTAAAPSGESAASAEGAQSAAPDAQAPAAAPADSGEVDSAQKDNSATFRVAAQAKQDDFPIAFLADLSPTARSVVLLSAVAFVIALLYGVLAQLRLRRLRRSVGE